MNESSAVDLQSVERARLQIQQLVQRVAQLSKQDLTEREYYEQVLPLIVLAISAVGGAVWRIADANRLELICQVNLGATQLDKEGEHQSHHGQLVSVAANSADGLLVLPYAGTGDGRPGANPTEYLLVLSPVQEQEHAVAVIEVFQRANAPLETRLGYLKFLSQMCELAAQWHRGLQLRRLREREAIRSQLDDFTHRIYSSIDLTETAYSIANELQRQLQCDRVTVALARGQKCRIAAISGQDELERRSDLVQSLQALAGRVMAVNEPLWYPEDMDAGLPPQLEGALHDYLDAAQVRSVAVLPLQQEAQQESPDKADADKTQRPQPLGVLLIEHLESERSRDSLASQLELLVPHCQRALINARQYEGILLLPVLQRLEKLRWMVRARNLSTTAIVAVLLLLAGLSLVFIRAPFHLEGRGVLQPVSQRDVFVKVEGTVTKILVEHGQSVVANEVLLQLENPDLEATYEAKVGEHRTTQQRMHAIHRQRHQEKLDLTEKNRLAGELLELEQQLASLATQCQLLDGKRQRLQVRSPITGKVITWNLEQLLLHRPVSVGQILLTVADPSDHWELEVSLPENRLGHVTGAQAGQSSALAVEYVIATAPTDRCHGTLREIHSQAELHEEHGHTVSLFVDVDQQELLDPHPGATVIAHFDCGSRSLGYVWLHEVFEFVDSRILFNLW